MAARPPAGWNAWNCQEVVVYGCLEQDGLAQARSVGSWQPLSTAALGQRAGGPQGMWGQGTGQEEKPRADCLLRDGSPGSYQTPQAAAQAARPRGQGDQALVPTCVPGMSSGPSRTLGCNAGSPALSPPPGPQDETAPILQMRPGQVQGPARTQTAEANPGMSVCLTWKSSTFPKLHR